VEDYCYIANVGDSRAILSTERGKFAFNLSKDHRPIDTREQQRIFSKGGKIYRTEMTKLTKKEEKS
jgi:serine/threonine protein phosphatase PrpC